MDVSGDTLGWTIEDCYCVGGKGFMARWPTGIVLGSVSSGSYSLDDEHADKLGSQFGPTFRTHSLTNGELGLLTD